MKTTSHLALFLALAASPSFAEPAYTAPVGYTTVGGAPVGYTTPVGGMSERLRPGMNVIGLSLHHGAFVSGTIGSIGKDFAELVGTGTDAKGVDRLRLVQGKTYIFEIVGGQKAGVIQEITAWQGHRLTLPDDLAAAGVKPGDPFSIRQAATLNSIFDPRFTPLKKGADPATADLVMIPQGTSFGDFRHCFIAALPGGTAAWLDAATFEPVGDLPLVYPDGLVVRCQGPQDLQISFGGEIKPGPTRSVVKPGLNLIASPSPAGGFLQDLGLADDLRKSDDFMDADKVWLADGPYGHFITYFLTAGGQWVNASNGEDVTKKIPVGSAMLIERKGPEALFCLGD